MPKTSPKLKATKPKKAFEKPLQADFKALFKALSKGVGHTAIGKREETGNDTVEALYAIGLSTEPNELVFLLVRRSLVKAMFDLVAESASPQLAETEQDADALIEQLDFSISTRPFHIDRQFLDRPAELRLVGDAQALLQAWLQGQAGTSEMPSSIGHKYADQARYQNISTPFS